MLWVKRVNGRYFGALGGGAGIEYRVVGTKEKATAVTIEAESLQSAAQAAAATEIRNTNFEIRNPRLLRFRLCYATPRQVARNDGKRRSQ
jgi:hypothetical protein